MSTTTRRPGGKNKKRSGADSGIIVRSPGAGTVHAMTPATVEAVRYFLARLEMNDTGIPQRLGVTSALSGEGVTYISRSIAAVIAQDYERSVCVVDLNWWDNRRRAPESDDAAAPASLMDLVRETATVDDVMQPTSIPGLSLISAGRLGRERRHTVAESDELAHAIDEVAARFDHVIVDLPAVLKTSATLSVARLCDAFTLVVRQGVTSEFQVAAALEDLRRFESVGIVLNATVTRTPKRIQRLLGF